MTLLHNTQYVDDAVLIVLAGEVDLATIDRLRQVILDAIAMNPLKIAVDLRGLVFIDCAGIRTIINARDAAHEHEIGLYVTNPRGQVRYALAVTGVLGALTCRACHTPPPTPDKTTRRE